MSVAMCVCLELNKMYSTVRTPYADNPLARKILFGWDYHAHLNACECVSVSVATTHFNFSPNMKTKVSEKL